MGTSHLMPGSFAAPRAGLCLGVSLYSRGSHTCTRNRAEWDHVSSHLLIGLIKAGMGTGWHRRKDPSQNQIFLSLSPSNVTETWVALRDSSSQSCPFCTYKMRRVIVTYWELKDGWLKSCAYGVGVKGHSMESKCSGFKMSLSLWGIGQLTSPNYASTSSAVKWG